MKSIDLKNYLLSTGLFRPDNNCLMVEVDGDKIYNRIPVRYKQNSEVSDRYRYNLIDIKKYVEKYGKQERCVDFIIAGVNIYATHVLNELDFPTLVKELDRTLGSIPKFQKWKTKELRNFKINNII